AVAGGQGLSRGSGAVAGVRGCRGGQAWFWVSRHQPLTPRQPRSYPSLGQWLNGKAGQDADWKSWAERNDGHPRPEERWAWLRSTPPYAHHADRHDLTVHALATQSRPQAGYDRASVQGLPPGSTSLCISHHV